MVERWLVPLIPFPSYKLCASDRPGAVKGARFARRSEPLTARTDLESYEGEGKGILQPSSHLPTKIIYPALDVEAAENSIKPARSTAITFLFVCAVGRGIVC